MNLPPKDSTCSFTLGRTSEASMTAPKRLAVAMACKPATPTPKMTTRAALTVPAAVMSMGKKRWYLSEATMTAL